MLLEAAARVRPREAFKLLILAGASFAPFVPEMYRLGLEDRIIVRENVMDIEDYLGAADLGLFTSESESFCLSILEGMFFGFPSVAPSVGGIPEVIEDQKSGLLVPFGEVDRHVQAVESLIQNPAWRKELGQAAQKRARELFSTETIVPQYEAMYRRVCG